MRKNRRSSDEGSTLIETLVSLALVMTTMGALGTFFVNSFLLVGQQRVTQTAAQLANNAIAQVRALRGSSLVSNHSFLKTDQLWCSVPFPAAGGAASQVPSGATARGASCAANAATPYLLNLQEVWDPLLPVTSTQGDNESISTAPQQMTVDNLTYTRTIYVGACDIYTNSLSGACVNPTVVAPPSDSTMVLEYFRPVVLITWPGRSCTSGTCSFVTSTLVSKASEPTFDFHRPSPVVTTTTATFYAGTPTTFPLAASGGQLPNTWSITALPAGLTLTPAGVISGTPTTVGTKAATATVTDSLGRADTGAITFKVVAALTYAGPASTTSHVGDTVSLASSASGGVPSYAYSVANGSALAPGLSIDAASGAITGQLTTAGTYTTKLWAVDSNTTFAPPTPAVATYTHTVLPAVTLAAIPDQTVTLGSTVSVTASGGGGDNHLTYSASGLPIGVSINSSTGVVSGLPTGTGRWLPTVTVTDGAGGSATVRFAIVVNGLGSQLVFTSPSLTAADQTGQVGVAPNLTIGNNGGLLGLNPTVTVSGLPPGLNVNPGTGVVTGKPKTAGTYVVTAVATSLTPAQVSTLIFLWTIT